MATGCSQIRASVNGTALEPQITDATAAILLARFTFRPIPEICAMGGITLEDFSQSVAYREIFGLGEERGREQGLKTGELEITLRLLQRRCGSLTASQDARIRALPLTKLEALAEALLDCQGADDWRPGWRLVDRLARGLAGITTPLRRIRL